MSKLEPISWHPGYSVQIKAIDEQHQRLFGIVNTLIDLYQQGSDDLLPAFHGLVDFVSQHFHTEHMAMKKMKYPGLAEHMAEHESFTDRVLVFLKDYQADDEELTLNMIRFLGNWVTNHTLNVDLKYRDYMLKYRFKL
jgi:hemerythrin-like metal-binding protein